MALLPDSDLASLWDVVSTRRVEAERVAAASRPATNLGTDWVEVVGAWVWSPAGCLDSPQSWPVLASKQVTVDRTPRLKEGLGRGRCQIDKAGAFKPGQSALGRTLQLLRLTLEAWSSFASTVRWAETQLVLFPPEGVAQETWLDTVIQTWPGAIKAYSVVVTPLSVEDWFAECLSTSSGVKRVLLLNVNSRLSTADSSCVNAGHAVGECVTAIHLHRVESGGAVAADGWRLYPARRTTHEPRQGQSRSDTQDLTRIVRDLEQTAGITVGQVTGVVTDGATTDNRFTQLTAFMRAELEACEPAHHVVGAVALAGDVGHCATVLVQLGVAYLLAVERAQGAVLVLDRYRSDATAGWLLVR